VTYAQGVFLAGLALVLLAVGAFGAVMLRAAGRSDGGAYPTRSLFWRLVRSPAERNEYHRWAFYLHRLTGVLVFGFLALHLADVALYGFGPSAYANVHRLYGTAVLRVFECGLLFGILFHTLNGLRLILVDLADLGVLGARRLLEAVALLTAVLGIAGSAIILGPVFS
jgi:succinate dehydrogenase / fumarate reductase, cytochrome b subunit